METIWLGDSLPNSHKQDGGGDSERVTLDPLRLKLLAWVGLGAGILMVGLGLTSLAFSPLWLSILLLLGSAALSTIVFLLFRLGNQLASAASASLGKVHERSVKFRMTKIDLEEIDRIKTDFFNNISHEFRTPITLTLGPIQGLLAGRYGNVDEPARQQLKNMGAQQQRLLGLINQILEAAKLEAGLAELKASRVKNFNEFITSRAEQFRTLSEQRGLELKITTDPKAAYASVYLDREKFDKILFNLLSNAHKFTSKGSIQISTKLQGQEVLVTIQDTGQGIREDQLTHIFERFRQAEGSVSKDFAGTGLGLNLVREYTRLHGGDVSVTSIYGKGTTFTIRIPTGSAHLSPQSIVSAQEEEIQTTPTSIPVTETKTTTEDAISSNPDGPKVLYVDDNPELRQYVGRLLKDRYHVALAENGRLGLETARTFLPELILSDVMMPEMDGTEFCRRVREDATLKNIPFVLLTARAELDQKLSGLEIGADDYLSKPFSEAELLARVKNLVALRQNQNRLTRELEAARSIQQSLLPSPIVRQEVGLDFLWNPCDQLSGDFCDLIDRDEWIYGYVADVTSHGTASAQVTYLLKSIFRDLLEKDAPSLDRLIGEANRRYGSYQLPYDAALQVFRLQPATRLFEYARGSAPSALVVASSGESKSLMVRPGPNLAAPMEGRTTSEINVTSVTLTPGDRVYLFTDGAFELHDDRQGFRLKDLHAILSSLPLEAWDKVLLEKLTHHRERNEFPDDITVLRLLVKM